MSGTGKKKDQGVFGSLVARLLSPLGLISRPWVLCLALLSGLAVAMFLGWRFHGDKIASDPSYLLTAEKIEITPPPQWIRSDVKGEVAQYALAERRDIRDPELTVHMAQAFAMHPWVATVRRVSKQHPAHVTVEIDYRRPAAMVEVVSEEGKRWLYPVDQQGVLLPTQDFSPEQALTYPRLNVGDTMHAGPIGSAWGDRRVHAGALIAAALQVYWHQLGLYKIGLASTDALAAGDSEPTFCLLTRAGTRIVWGRQPGKEYANEPASEIKIQRLLAYAQEHKGLDAPSRSAELDLQYPADTSQPQAAIRPGSLPR